MRHKTAKRQPITDIIPAPGQQPWFNWRRLADYRNRLLVCLVVVVALLSGGLYYHSHQTKTTGPSGQGLINDTVNRVSKLMLLPAGEQPTLAIVNDASKYSNSAFFKNAANGDRLLIYARAEEAILYRPSINKIIAVAPLNVNAGPASTSSQP